jgi:hypothetical protein
VYPTYGRGNYCPLFNDPFAFVTPQGVSGESGGSGHYVVNLNRSFSAQKSTAGEQGSSAPTRLPSEGYDQLSCSTPQCIKEAPVLPTKLDCMPPPTTPLVPSESQLTVVSTSLPVDVSRQCVGTPSMGMIDQLKAMSARKEAAVARLREQLSTLGTPVNTIPPLHSHHSPPHLPEDVQEPNHRTPDFQPLETFKFSGQFKSPIKLHQQGERIVDWCRGLLSISFYCVYLLIYCI